MKNYVQAQTDFTTTLTKAEVEAVLRKKENIFHEIKNRHEELSQLIEEERSFIVSAAPYDTNRFEEGK